MRSPLLIVLVFIADQVTKHAVMVHFDKGGPWIDILPCVRIVLSYNRGISFSLLSSHQALGFWFLTGAIGAMILGVSVWWVRARDLRLPLALILGGALGNLYDRLTVGGVVDFLDVFWHNYHWPAFNVADSCICLGAIWIGFRSFGKQAKA